MNNSQLQPESPVISTMASGERADAWHWRSGDVRQLSIEKLHSILSLPTEGVREDDLRALQEVREELERRTEFLKK